MDMDLLFSELEAGSVAVSSASELPDRGCEPFFVGLANAADGADNSTYNNEFPASLSGE